MSAKISVIMPSLNVGRYIKMCIDSVTGQTLKDLEIICVDAGSNDGTLEILKEAAAADSRIRIIHSDIKSYGYQMNLGLANASGEYIGIIETDDWAEPEMFSTLYSEARENDLDVIKSGFWFYYSVPKEKNTAFNLPAKYAAKGVFCPATDLKSSSDLAEFFNIKPSIWSAIYRRDFLERNGIKFNETPGASYQDAGFNFKVWACAERVKIITDAFLHYRQDNEQSSVNSPAKAMCVCDEYKEIKRFIYEKAEGEKKALLLALMERLKYDSYVWNYVRLASPLDREFARTVSSELKSDVREGFVKEEFFPHFKWESFKLWTEDADAFADALDKRNDRSFIEKAFGRLGRMLKRG